MNIDKLKGKLIEKRKTYADCATALNTTVTTFNNKMNGKSKFYIDEVRVLCDFLNLNNHEKVEIFLT